MKVSVVQATLAVLICTTFLSVSAVIALAPVVGGYPPEAFTEHLKTFASMYSGVIGVVVGYFFGKRTDTGAA